MTTLHVLLPPLAGVREPAFHAWLAHGNPLPAVTDARTATLRALFPFSGATLPAAALRHACHGEDAADGTWLCADPAWVRSEATGARLMAWPLDDLDADEAAALAAALRPLFDDAGVPLTVDTPAEWCVQARSVAADAGFVNPQAALGASLIDCLPHGDAGRPWRRLFTDAQVLLHGHPVNAARRGAGKHPVNALWFWGPGALPGSTAAAVQAVASVDDVLRGLARLGGATRLEPLPKAIEATRPATAVLLDLDIAGHPDPAGAWLGAFERWLRRGRFDAIVLTFSGGERYELRRMHRLRFWRRA